MIFGINTRSDILKLLYVIFDGIYAKYHVQIMLLFVHTTTRRRFYNFHTKVFQIKLKYQCSKPIKLQKFLMQQYKLKYCHRLAPDFFTFCPHTSHLTVHASISRHHHNIFIQCSCRDDIHDISSSKCMATHLLSLTDHYALG